MAAQVALRRQNAISDESTSVNCLNNTMSERKQINYYKNFRLNKFNNGNYSVTKKNANKIRVTADFLEQHKLYHKNLKKLREQAFLKNSIKKSN